MFGEDLTDEMTPRINRYYFFRFRPLGVRRDPRRRRGVGQIGAMVSSKRLRCNCKRAIDRISA